MAVKKIRVFDDNNNLVEVQAKLQRETDHTISASDKSAMRTELGTPASAEGLTPANNLSDVSSDATSRTNLKVLSRSEVFGVKQSGAGLYFDGTNDTVALGDQTKLEPGADRDFTLSGIAFFPVNPASAMMLYNKRPTGGVGVNVQIDTSGRLFSFIADSGGGTGTPSDGDSLAGHPFIWMITYDRSGVVTRYVNDLAYGTTANISSRNGSLASSDQARIGGTGSGNYFDGIIWATQVWNCIPSAAARAEFMKTGIVPVGYQWAGDDLTSGSLVVGQRYIINSYQSADDFTNVGASSNATGIEFVATGTTPTTWTNSSVITPAGVMADVRGSQALDHSTNGLHGTISGAAALDVPQTVEVNAVSPASGSALANFQNNGTSRFKVLEDGKINMGNLPTSSAGLSSGDLWSNSGVLTVVS